MYYGLSDEKDEQGEYLNVPSKNFTEIGAELGITRERVRQLMDRALKVLRSNPVVMARLRTILED